MTSSPVSPIVPDQEGRLTTFWIHALYAASFFLGITFIIGGIWAYMKRHAYQGTPWHSHVQFAISTFWWALGILVFSVFAWIILLGWAVLLFYQVWLIWRIAKSFYYWSQNAEIPNPYALF